MTDLFDKKDILTGVTVDQAVIDAKGFFGDSLRDLINTVERNNVRTLSYIDKFDAYCFTNDAEQHYTLFLPLDKVKKPTFRALKNIDELFSFMMPDINDRKYTTDQKIDVLLGHHYVLKNKDDGTIRYYTVHFLSISACGTVILDDFDLMYLFDKYEYRKGDSFVPFGVEIKND